MEDPPIRSSKKRLFGECSSSSFFDPDIIEIPPPPSWKPKSSKKKSIINQEIVVVDDEDADDVVIIGEKIAPNDKGKKPIIYPAEDEVITLDDLPSPRAKSVKDGIAAEILPPSTDAQSTSSQDPILKKLELFKKFDTLEDHLGHFYESKKESVKQCKKWVNRIADEWRMLEKDLPDTIFVRVYEARMDLLRAVIVGADGTPYHDGLFFFDVHFPTTYPNNPPLVTYHAHGLRINPNLYAGGKVCLSLLGTWGGQGVEKWRPGKSNMLQVLVSIQGLVLNEDPYYNEPGCANSKNVKSSHPIAKNYSENAFLLSLKTMVYTMKNPPKYFEDLVNGHFYNRAHDILAACRAYLEGVEVGSYVKGKTVTAKGKTKTCSQLLSSSLPTNIKSLVEAFTKIGVKDCEKYLVPVGNVVNQPPTQGAFSSRANSKFFAKSKFMAPGYPGHFLY